MKVEVQGKSPAVRGLRLVVEAAVEAAVEADLGLGRRGGLISQYNECTPPNLLGALLHSSSVSMTDSTISSPPTGARLEGMPALLSGSHGCKLFIRAYKLFIIYL